MFWLTLVIVSLLVAWVLSAVTKAEVPGGYWNMLVGALIGAWLGDLVLRDWGWMLAGYNVIAGIIGSLLIGWLYIKLISKKQGTEKTEISE